MSGKKHTLHLVVAFGLLASLMVTSISAQSDTSSTAEGQITIKDGGVLEVSICLDNDAGTLVFTDAASNNLSESPFGTATIFVCYTDSQAERRGFEVYMWADEWNSTDEANANTIPADRLIFQTMYSPVSQIVDANRGGEVQTHNGANIAIGAVGPDDPVIQMEWEGESLASAQLVGWANTGPGSMETRQQVDLKLDATDIPPGLYTTTIYLDLNPPAP